MKNLFKKCVSALCAAVILSSFAVPAMAENTRTTGVTVLAEFNNFEYKDLSRTLGDTSGTQHQIAASTVAYGSGKSSLVWKLQDGSEFLYKPQVPIKISSTDIVKVRMKASKGKQTINVIFDKADKTYTKKTADVTEDWKEFSYTGLPESIDIKFNCGGWSLVDGTHYNTGESIYIDSIWIEKADAVYNKAAYPLNGSDDAAAELVVFNTSNTKNVTLQNNGWKQSATATNARENGNGMYRLFTVPALLPRTNTVTTNTVDVAGGGYQYINMWVYSPRPQNGGVRIHYNGTLIKGLNMDWSGWRLVSFALPSEVKTAAAAKEIKLISNEWARSKLIAGVQGKLGLTNVQSVSGTTEAACTSEVKFGIESIWLSKNQPVGANEAIAPAAAEALAAPDTDIVIADYNKADASIPANATQTANSYKGGKSARSRRFGGEYLSGNATDGYKYTNFNVSGCAKEAEFTIFNDTSNPYTGIEATDYLNFWIYNPSVKYDRTANYSEYILVVRHNASGSFANKTFGIIANFEGWKRFSIPMSEISSSWSADAKIELIKITANAWLPAANTDLAKTSHEHTAEELAKGYRAAGAFNTWPDIYNYFDFEKMWITKEKPAASFNNETFTLKFDPVNMEINNKDLRIGTGGAGFLGSITKDGVLLKKTGNNVFEAAETVTSLDSENIKVSPVKLLDVSSEYYIIYPEIYDSNGNEHRGRRIYKITTKDNYLGAIVVDAANPASASVTYRGAVPAERINSTLIGAVFNGDGTLKSAEVARYSADNQTMTVTLDGAQDGDTVKYFLFDVDSLKPFQNQVERVIGEPKN
ncbi:MAG: hypothetical protein J6N52_10500 [Clostridia bacterium]|nr:hypothetical protein [Clostridia bacterium]